MTLTRQILLLSLTLTAPLFGWGQIGHQTMGELAERQLSPQARQFVFDILGAEPLGVASLFADLARPDPAFDPFIPYHYVDIPSAVSPRVWAQGERGPKDALTFLTSVPRRLLDPSASTAQKQIWLRYLVHVVGDLHQPLHVGNTVDRLGALCDVQWFGPGEKRATLANLHSLWDERLFDFVEEAFYDKNPIRRKEARRMRYSEFADELEAWLRAEPPAARYALWDSLPGDFVSWFEESRALDRVVYPDGKTLLTPQTRPYCKQVDPKDTAVVRDGLYDVKKLPKITAQYVDQAVAAAKVQIVKAGYRLGLLLNAIAEGYPVPEVNSSARRALLESAAITRRTTHPAMTSP